MKRSRPLALLAVLTPALLVASVALPACAQHGASHGGFSGHASSPSRGGFAASAPSRFSGFRSAPVARGPGFARGPQRPYAGNPAARQPYTGSWRYRRPYISPYRGGGAYIVPGYGWVSPYFLGNPDYGYDDSSDQQGAVAGSYAEPQDQAPDQAQFQGPYQQPPYPLPPSQPNTAMATAAQPDEEAITLIFKDGRPPEQIHNYLLTRTTLFVGDQHQRAIPISQLDGDATERVNRDAGVDFQLPGTLK